MCLVEQSLARVAAVSVLLLVAVLVCFRRLAMGPLQDFATDLTRRLTMGPRFLRAVWSERLDWVQHATVTQHSLESVQGCVPCVAA